jgi:hypothetical protein
LHKNLKYLPLLSIQGCWRDLHTESKQKGEICMQYLLLIYGEEKLWDAYTETEKQTMYKGYGELIQDMKQKGNYMGGHQLQPVAMATTVRVRNGKKSITDGPFAETKEQLGGYFLVEAKNLDEALALAARIPSATEGSIEVRPVVMMGNS